VRIQGRITPDNDPIGFYSKLRLGSFYSFQSGAIVMIAYALNDRQEIHLVAGPRLDPSPKDPPPNNLSLVLFETSDVVALHDYLQSRNVAVGDVTADGFQANDLEGKPMHGDPSLFMLQDPDDHLIGFIQYKSPLRFHEQDGQTSSRLIHTGIVVKDRPAMEHFYKDILGFRPYWHGGRTDERDDWVSLQVPDGSDWVEFMLNVPDDADKRQLGVANHIALGVTNIQAAKAQLIKNGVTLTEEPKIGRGSKWQLNVYDPDGTRIEFMEFTPVQKPCCSEYTAPHPKP